MHATGVNVRDGINIHDKTYTKYEVVLLTCAFKKTSI